MNIEQSLANNNERAVEVSVAYGVVGTVGGLALGIAVEDFNVLRSMISFGSFTGFVGYIASHGSQLYREYRNPEQR